MRKVAEVGELVNALQIVNHHAKDLQKLETYISFCLAADQLTKKRQIRDLLDFGRDIKLCTVAKEHYNVALKAYFNWNFGFCTNMHIQFKHPDVIPNESPMSVFWDVDMDLMFADSATKCTVHTPDFIITYLGDNMETNTKFTLPDLDLADLVIFADKIKSDINMLYSLKNQIINRALSEKKDNSLYAIIIGRQEDENGKKYVSINLHGKLFHYPDEKLFYEHPDLPVNKFSGGASNKSLYCFKKLEVREAVNTLSAFLTEKR